MAEGHGSRAAAFTTARVPLETRLRRAAVRSVLQVTPAYRRIEFAGADLAGFDSPGADDHLRLFFPPSGQPLPALTGEGVPSGLESREYTPVSWDGVQTLVIDFVLHGDGLGGRWAETAVPGDQVYVGGPRRSLVFDGRPEWWLLIGDLTSLPAIRRLAAQVPSGVPVDVILACENTADEQEVTSTGDLTVTWVHPGSGSDDSVTPLLDALREVPARPGDGFAFVAAEQGIVAPARALLAERGVDLERSVVKGYWKRS